MTGIENDPGDLGNVLPAECHGEADFPFGNPELLTPYFDLVLLFAPSFLASK